MKYGMIATGSKEASEAALEILKVGGNAFDASVAAVMTSMTSEVNLTSMAGGGAMLAYKNGHTPVLYDFFVDTPPNKNKELDFFDVQVNFGESKQTFYIGKGSVAVPGTLLGLVTIQEQYGILPLSTVLEPAINIAEAIGVSKIVISMTMVAFGTSLPELATSVVAVIKKEYDLLWGNIIGSNIMNILLVLGSSVLINQIEFDTNIIAIILMFSLTAGVFLYSIFKIEITFLQKDYRWVTNSLIRTHPTRPASSCNSSCELKRFDFFNFSAKKTSSGQFNEVKFPFLTTFFTALSTSLLEYPKMFVPTPIRDISV